jgi:uncharacterized repeat protein (TIGR03803 family)
MAKQYLGGIPRAGLLLIVALVAGAQAQTFTDLYNFTGGTDGADPCAGVIRDAAGNIYGTTVFGGSFQYGTVFKVDSKGKETVLHSFAGPDGADPWAGVIRDAAGNIYGTTVYGGCCKDGTVFKLDSKGTETVLHSFTGGTTDGCNTDLGLVEDKSGNLYGATYLCGAYGYGAVFKLSKDGKVTLLHSFAGGSDGEFPHYGSLFIDQNDNLYGQTSGGGGSAGCGVVYKVSKSGEETVLHTFAGYPTDGCYAYGPVTMDEHGNLYGTTTFGGSRNAGAVWKLSKSRKETILHNFGGTSDGAFPSGGVILDANGNLYGDTETGGSSGDGIIFKLTKNGKETVLHKFSGTDGNSPVGGVFRDTKGTLYGATLKGGSYGYGTVWKLTP